MSKKYLKFPSLSDCAKLDCNVPTDLTKDSCEQINDLKFLSEKKILQDITTIFKSSNTDINILPQNISKKKKLNVIISKDDNNLTFYKLLNDFINYLNFNKINIIPVLTGGKAYNLFLKESEQIETADFDIKFIYSNPLNVYNILIQFCKDNQFKQYIEKSNELNEWQIVSYLIADSNLYNLMIKFGEKLVEILNQDLIKNKKK